MLALSIGMGVSRKRCIVFVLPTHISLHQLHRRRSLLRRRLCPLFSLLFSPGQTKVVVAVAVVVAAARPPMPPPVRVHPPAVVPRQALVTMCHRNPCLMGRQPAGSQEHKEPGQRSVLAPRVPARGHATSGRMIPKLEGPPLPSLLSLSLSLYVCGSLRFSTYMLVVCDKGKERPLGELKATFNTTLKVLQCSKTMTIHSASC